MAALLIGLGVSAVTLVWLVLAVGARCDEHHEDAQRLAAQRWRRD